MKKILLSMGLLSVSLLQAKEFKIFQAFEPTKENQQFALAQDKTDNKVVLVSNDAVHAQKLKFYDGLIVNIKDPIVVDVYTYETTAKVKKTIPIVVNKENFLQLVKEIKKSSASEEEKSKVEKMLKDATPYR